jgi:peptide/nickel transport system ATP-binding protein
MKGKRLPVLSDFLPNDKKNELTVTGLPQQFPDKTNTSSVIKVENLCAHFPLTKNFWGRTTSHHKALDNVTFEIMKGETMGIVGESGCGKTTLGKALLGLVKPTSGQIFIHGRETTGKATKPSATNARDMQIVFQDPYGSLNPRITIGEAIGEPMKVHQLFPKAGERKEKTMDLLRSVGLSPDQFHKYPHQFSGGQRQRICIARSLALSPSILVFDESVSALDVSVQAQVLNLINELKTSYKFTSLFISHDLSVVHYISDRILVMKEGKIVEQGDANQIFFEPQDEYTRELISSIPGRVPPQSPKRGI